jgi:DNA-binding response OmpR family regulator
MSPSPRLLVVDDEEDVRWALQTILRRGGYGVATSGSGAETLAWLRDNTCQLILLDAKLGDMDGIALARQIRDQRRSCAPVILVSGNFYKDDAMVQDSMMIGLIAAFVAKPFRQREILDAVSNTLAGLRAG